MIEQTWYEGEEVTEDITIEALEAMCSEMKTLQQDITKQKEELKKANTVFDTMKRKFMLELHNSGKEKYVSEVGTFYTINEFSVQTPKTEEDKKNFFHWCKEEGIFWDVASVNSRKLQSLYKSKLEEVGETFTMPGVPEAKLYKKLGVRAK